MNAFRRWGMLAIVSAIFFATTGGTFSSLTILLPTMIEDLGWNWTGAGAGYTLIGLLTGLSSTLPAYTLKMVGERNGLQVVYLTGGLIIMSGFILIATAHSLVQYWIGASLVGIGYSQTGAVPAVHLASGWFGAHRARAIGVFFTAGALGSVTAPLVSSSIVTAMGAWRPYWWIVIIVIAALTALAALLVRSAHAEVDEETKEELRELSERRSGQEISAEEKVAHPSEINWSLAEVMRNPQYYVIIAAHTVTLLGGITMSTVAGGHLEKLGVNPSLIAWAISGHAMFNVFARAFGGAIAQFVDAKWLLASGLAAGAVGMFALAYADNVYLIALFALADGYCFGIVVFSSTILLLNYFGSKDNPAILGTANLITTLAMIGPIAAGWVGDVTGGFTPAFLLIGALMVVPCLAVLLMPRPVYRGSTRAG